MELDQPGDGAGPDGQAADSAAAAMPVTAGAPAARRGPLRTGDDRADEAVAAVGTLTGRPLGEHAAVFAQVHARLVEVLGELDAGQPGTGPPAGAPPAGPGAAVPSAERPGARD